ncbi:REST corepressor [Ditylenchus destructor]|nr:REST corepressor [Ditylenchus destructor]
MDMSDSAATPMDIPSGNLNRTVVTAKMKLLEAMPKPKNGASSIKKYVTILPRRATTSIRPLTNKKTLTEKLGKQSPTGTKPSEFVTDQSSVYPAQPIMMSFRPIYSSNKEPETSNYCTMKATTKGDPQNDQEELNIEVARRSKVRSPVDIKEAVEPDKMITLIEEDPNDDNEGNTNFRSKRTRPFSNRTNNSGDIVRRSKRKINPPNFFAGGSKMDESKEDSPSVCANVNPVISASPMSRRGVIRVGPSFQASPLPEQMHYVKESPAYPDRDECLWIPMDKSMQTDTKDFENFCHAARRHQNLPADEAMEVLYHNSYSVTDSLIHLEEYRPRIILPGWSSEEIDIFNKHMSKGAKRFNIVAKHLPNKTTADTVEYYYRTKKTRCFLADSGVASCPHILLNSVQDPPAIPRYECHNCLKDLGRTSSVSGDNRGKKKVPICPACDLYSRITKRHRPFAVHLSSQEKSFASRLKNGVACETIPSNENPPTHPNCYFKQKITSLLRPVIWSEEEISVCVKGFRKYGNNFAAIAAELRNSKTAYDVADFYTENQLIYRLDFMVQLFEKDSIVCPPQLQRSKRHINNVPDDAPPPKKKYLRLENKNCDSDNCDKSDSDKSMDVKYAVNNTVPKNRILSVVTRNQRKLKDTRVVASVQTQQRDPIIAGSEI